jgi:hypothetical protein
MSQLHDYASSKYAMTADEFHSLPAGRKLQIAQEWVDLEWLHGVRQGVCTSVIRDIEEQRPEHHALEAVPAASYADTPGWYAIQYGGGDPDSLTAGDWLFALCGFMLLCGCLGTVILAWMLLKALGHTLGVI